MAEPTAVQVKEKIDLTDTEMAIFYTLIEIIREFELNTEPRVAGGWVRDKLLGKECHDIDIALDNMSGSEFVNEVTMYFFVAGLEPPAGIGKIPSKPDKSKHLETTRMMLFELWIDLVNLRCEEYSENSRIPTMKFGTAKEDAYRRDLTINSLFYNINTNSVEDLTGRGSRFLFILDEELKKAATSNEVKTALAAKISRERIGIEYHTLFATSKLSAAYLDAAWNLIQLIGCSSFNVSVVSLVNKGGSAFMLLCFFLSERPHIRRYCYNLLIPIVNYIFRDSLKRKASDAETVINIHRALDTFLSLIPSLVSADNEVSELVNQLVDVRAPSKLRVLTGEKREEEEGPYLTSSFIYSRNLLREIKDFWRVALLISTLLYPIDVDSTQDILGKNFQLDKRRDLFTEVENAIIKLGLEKVWDVKPLVNGKEIMNVLQLKSGGPLVRKWQQKLLDWQLAHPSGTAEE
ncbi:hypothetical protein EZV62_000304 [Acer yangbiense]|uniref:Poly A polymerase head domain-containing protein n=1 Tax=Acer yangbiense TaxID=1000413 RepID=A0A5C7IR47_9ROSI|nr:hypothetical protein EZV62_000304 [Acer yangbiense]